MRWVVAQRRSALEPVFVVGSHTGQVGVPWAALLVALRFALPDGERIVLRRGLVAVFGGWAVAHAAKRTNRRQRPCQDGEAPPLVRCPKSSSLPSDEAACAFAGAAYASAALPQLRPLLYLGASFTATARLYVGAHYPSDVIAGALVGAALAELIRELPP